MEKLGFKPCATFLRNKYTVFTRGGTVALRSVNKNFSGELHFAAISVAIYEIFSNGH